MNQYEKIKENQIRDIIIEHGVSRDKAEEIRLQRFREMGRRGGAVGGRPFKQNPELAREAQALSVKARRANSEARN